MHRSVWEPTRSRSVRAVWNAGGERRCSRGPLRPRSNFGVPLFAMARVSTRTPSGPCTAHVLAERTLRVLTPLVARGAHWRSLNRIPRPLTSFFTLQARTPSSKPEFRCRPARFSPCDEVDAHFGFTCSARTARRKPREGSPPNDPGRLPSCRDVRELSPEDPNLVHPVVEDDAPRFAHPFAFDTTAARVSTAGNSAFGTTMLFRLGRAHVVCLATCRASRPRCVRPMTASQHSKNENPYSLAPGSSSATCAAACTRWVPPPRPRNRTVHDVRNASGDRRIPRGVFVRSEIHFSLSAY